MASKKTYKAPAVEEAVEPAAFEQPADCQTPCDDCVCEPEPEITPSEALEAPSEATTPAPKAKTYTAKDGDSYALIAELHPVEGVTKHDRAMQLWRDHGGRKLKDGTVITL